MRACARCTAGVAALDNLVCSVESQQLVSSTTERLIDWPKAPADLLQPALALLQPLRLGDWVAACDKAAKRAAAGPSGMFADIGVAGGDMGMGMQMALAARSSHASVEAVAVLAASVRRRFGNHIQALHEAAQAAQA